MRPRALIVDFDPVSALATGDALRSAGFLVAEVQDAAAALKQCARGVPELFVIDIVLPGMGGLELLQTLRADPSMGEAGIIMLCTIPDRATCVASLQFGADDFLFRPCDLFELSLRARNLVERRAGSLGGEARHSRRDIVAMFADVRGFTPLAEKIDPETSVTILNDLFDALDSAITSHGGYVDKFIGDGLMALFGARDEREQKEFRACRAALEMQARARAFAEESLSLASFADTFGIGIGLSCGEAVVGAVGARRKRTLTAIGDPVNLAARLQAIAERGEIVVDQDIAQRLGPFASLSAGREVHLKGKELPRTVYRLLGFGR